MILHLVAQRVTGQPARQVVLWASCSCEVILFGGNVLGFSRVQVPGVMATCVFTYSRYRLMSF